MPKIKIKKSRSVPYLLRIAGTIVLVIVFKYLLEELDEKMFILAAILISPLLPMLWMSVQILEINDDEKYWWQYHWILGYKKGKKTKYPSIDHLSLKSVQLKPRREDDGIRYLLTAHFTDDTECPMTRRKKLAFIREKAKRMAEKVKVKLVDQTLEEE
jgi:hypothetical protein